MRILSASREALLCFLVTSLLLSASFCHGSDDKTTTTSLFEVVGTGECADCSETNFKTSQAVSGLRVTIDCKPENGVFKTRGSGELDEEGKFTVSLPQEIVEDGKLKEECYAQLHSASAAPCPAHDGLESSKIVLKTKTNGKHTFGLAGKLKFSPVTCASAFFWPHYKHPSLPKWSWPPLPKYSHPKFKLPPLKSFGHHPFPFPPKVFHPKPPLPPLPPKPPLIKKPCPPKALPPPVPVVKPLPPPVPVKKFPPKPKVLPPKPPVIKKPCPPKPPLFKPPPVPIYKPKPKPPIIVKPLPPPVPIYKPKPKPPIFVKPHPPIPKVLPPPIPIYKPKPKPPIFVKPLPPLPKIPPFYKKPCPPLPKLPPLPKIPPKHFHHHKFGKWPPLPPFSPHPN